MLKGQVHIDSGIEHVVIRHRLHSWAPTAGLPYMMAIEANMFLIEAANLPTTEKDDRLHWI